MVGENRSLQVVEQEAIGFQRLLREGGALDSEDAFHNRLDQVQGEIKAGSVKRDMREDRSYVNVGGNGGRRTESSGLVPVELGEVQGSASCDPIARSLGSVIWEGSLRVQR